ncbi:MAG: NAD(P)/FAD-dependent oxidoreductase, partial [Bacillales bacterium]
MGPTIGLHDDKLIPSFRKFTDRIHAAGAKVIPQITHPGPESISWTFGVQPVGPSAYPNQFGQMVRELTVDEIKKIIGLYGDAARRAREAGFDGIEFHCAHAYMLAGSFLSPLRNKRTDAYGGDLDGRARFALEVLRDMKEKAGEDFPIMMRISGDERVPGGNSLSDMLYLIPKFIEAGADAFEISGSSQYEKPWKIIPGNSVKMGVNVKEAAAIKEISSVPVFVVGKIYDARYAEHILTHTGLDGVVMGRALLADPELPNKALAGKFDEIAPCTSCGIGCTTREEGRMEATCIINPAVGKEAEMGYERTEKSKRVLIIGGGVAGLEAARVLAKRGHHVKIIEKEKKLGGQINIASVPPFKQELTKWVIYLANAVQKSGVEIELGMEVTVERVKKENPDTIIVATGAEPMIPDIKGIENEKVVTGFDLLSGKENAYSGNILIIGGGMVGAEIADTIFANARGKVSVTIVEMLDDIAPGIPDINRIPLLNRLKANGTKIFTSSTVKEISANTVIIETEGREKELTNI